MTTHDPTFLRNPREIRKAIDALQGGRRLDLAVAFVGTDWRELLGHHKRKLRVICWLSSTNTNPYSVAELMEHRNTEVRQRDSMHCKVYVSPSVGAVVGSANLSKAALSDEETAGQDEAAMLLTDPGSLHDIEKWFGDLWKDELHTRLIEDSDLIAAKRSWDLARAHRNGTHFRRRSVSGAATAIPPLPMHLDTKILGCARKVRSLDLEFDIGEPSIFMKSIEPAAFTKDEQRQLVRHLVRWTRHAVSYQNFLAQPIGKVRRGLGILFDDGKDPLDRLKEIRDGGYLKGLRVPSLGLLLYWRKPEDFPPYNFRTETFLKDFGLLHKGMSAASPICYERWRLWATRLAQQLQLPTPGHLDRLVERYYEEKSI